MYRSPPTNAFAERFIQTVQVECLDKFLVFGPEHFDLLVKEYLAYDHQERPHQGKDNLTLRPSGAVVATGEVCCSDRLGGVPKHYYRIAA